MNKLRFSLLIGLLIFGSTTLIHAQVERRPVFYAGGGISFPLNPEPLTDFWKPGYNFGGGISYPLNEQLSLQILANYSRFSIDQEAIFSTLGLSGAGLSLGGGSANILTVTLGFKVYPQPPTSSISFYGLGGVGLIKLTASELTGPNGQSVLGVSALDNTAIGPGVGLGFDLYLGERVSLFAEGQYFLGLKEGDSTQYVPVRVGFSFQ